MLPSSSIPYTLNDAVDGSLYTEGSAYTSGANGVADDTLTPAPGDRVFVVELK